MHMILLARCSKAAICSLCRASQARYTGSGCVQCLLWYCGLCWQCLGQCHAVLCCAVCQACARHGLIMCMGSRGDLGRVSSVHLASSRHTHGLAYWHCCLPLAQLLVAASGAAGGLGRVHASVPMATLLWVWLVCCGLMAPRWLGDEVVCHRL